MKNKINEKGLLLYFSTYDQIEKIDDTLLGNFIKQEMQWMSGHSDEPQYSDVRCDCLHSRIKEQCQLREQKAVERQRQRAEALEKQAATVKPEGDSKVRVAINGKIIDESC